MSTPSPRPVASPVSIRLAATDDLAAIERITARAYEGYVDLLGGPPVPMTEDYRPRIAAGGVWLAEADAAPVGLIALEHHSGHLTIFSVAVEPAAHGRGVGRRLLTFAEERALAAEVDEVRLYTNALMARNLALYARLGYRERGRRPNPRRAGFTIVDMVKRIRSVAGPS